MSDRLVDLLSDDLDHPELWPLLPGLAADNPELIADLRASTWTDEQAQMSAQVLLALCEAEPGKATELAQALSPLTTIHDQSPLLQGALFFLHAMVDPGNPKFTLAGKICRDPFTHLDVNEDTAFLCCASWLPTSLGDPSADTVDQIWNGEKARAIRASIHDGSYRYCNKIVCPAIQQNILTPMEQLTEESATWRTIVDQRETRLEIGPELVNLCYDRTCNLSCPSCRAEAFAADHALRTKFASMQDRTILPLLKTAKIVVITGSGDPFASKNFRQLMKQLTPEDYPDLQFRIMTNGMLLNPEQWAAFPALHRRIDVLKISLDAARGPTHEMLRRGARWSTMLENLRFAGRLLAEGLIERFEISFVVQRDNYREMGEFVDLAHEVGANGVYFARIMNWERFTDDEYRERAIFMPGHPLFGDFIDHMQDPRLRDPIVWLGNLQEFIGAARFSQTGEGEQRLVTEEA